MNPNLNYAQAIPGITEGRGIGIIDTAELVGVVDACRWLEKSSAFGEADRKRMKEWFGAYLDWMLNSSNGKEEAAARNNHGTYFDLQAAAFALYIGRRDAARKIVEEARGKRIAVQIEPDGRMPLELSRTRSFSYSVMNLRGFFDLADLAGEVDVDLWRFRTSDGRSLRKALDYLAPYMDAARKWPEQQIGGGITPALRLELAVLLRRTSRAFAEPKYEEMTKAAAGEEWEAHRAQLLWPAGVWQKPAGQ
jgi:hypothetical protein